LSLAPAQTSGRPFSGDIEFFAGQIDRLTESLAHELPSGFAERVRYRPSELTPFPGRFSFERFPCFRKTAGCFSPLDPTQEVALMKGNQMGATTAVLETVLLYNIMRDPKAQMYVTADAGLVRTSVQVRVEKMIDNAGARVLIFSQSRKKKGSRNTGATAVAKEYPGGYLDSDRFLPRQRSLPTLAAIVSYLDSERSRPWQRSFPTLTAIAVNLNSDRCQP
jgi:hypothetical protein